MAAKFLVLAFAASALADPSYYGYGGYRSYGYGPYVRDGAVAYHPGGGYSSVSRSTQGIGKRSADAEPDADPSYYGGYYGGYYGRPLNYGYGHARSYEYRSPQGLRYRREAEPSYYGGSYQEVNRALPYGGISSYAVNDRVYGASVYDRRRTPAPYGYLRHKREAEPSYYSGSYQEVNRALPYGGYSSYNVRDNVYSARISESRNQGYNSYGYGIRTGGYGYY